MGDRTKIQWCDATWAVSRGCSRVSAGCEACYAERIAHRFSGDGLPYAGLTNPSGRWNGSVRFLLENLDQPLRWKRPRRVFVNSTSDLFHEKLTDEQIDQVFAVMLLAPRHKFQVLTKRPARMREHLLASDRYDRVLRAAGAIRARRPELCSVGISNPALFPAPWIWLGVSVEDQKTADERVPLLLETPAAVRFVSAEPLLGPVDFDRIELPSQYNLSPTVPGRVNALRRHDAERYWQPPSVLDWIIVGGESGPGARPCDVAWIRSIVDQCRDAGVACFAKQLGAKPVARDRWDMSEDVFRGADANGWDEAQGACVAPLRSRKGDDPAEWPDDLRVQQFPEAPRSATEAA